MMKILHRLVAVPALLLIVGCSDDLVNRPTVANGLELRRDHTDGAKGPISALSWNIYVGADVDAVISALVSPDPPADVPALLEAIQTLPETVFPARAEAIADEIGRRRPHVIGLQEVWNIDIDLTALGLPVDVDIDFLPTLESALAARGLNYSVAANVQNTDANPLPGLRVIDHDVILIDRERVTITSSVAQNFAANIGTVAPGVNLIRGWVAVEAMIHGQSYTIVNTHLESGAGEALSGLRALQAGELAATIARAPRVILMGDLNDSPGSAMYRVLTAADFVDVWKALRPRSAGLTCCHAADLSNRRAAFTQRIDYVFSRGFDMKKKDVAGRITIVGDQPRDRITHPVHDIWPSDHAGLAVSLRAP